MSKHKLWFGILEAGSKSSPVAIDRNMESNEKNSIFIYNHNRKEILKYSRDVVESKLRELNAKEKELETELKKGFSDSLKTFKYKIPKISDTATKSAAASNVKKPVEEPEVEISDVDDDDSWDDSDDVSDD